MCACLRAATLHRATPTAHRDVDPLHMTAARHKHCNVQLIAHNSCETQAHTSMSTHTQTHCLLKPQLLLLVQQLQESLAALPAHWRQRFASAAAASACQETLTQHLPVQANDMHAMHCCCLVMPGAATGAMLHISRGVGCCCRSSSSTIRSSSSTMVQTHEQCGPSKR